MTDSLLSRRYLDPCLHPVRESGSTLGPDFGSGSDAGFLHGPGPDETPLPQKHRVILHSDMNCFYANVECMEHPELRDKPVAVGGNVEQRHGIILAKNQIAKAYGVQTAETLWQARLKCPDLVIVPPDYALYLRYSRMARAIYYDYSDLVEPFGPDEAWIDITGSAHLWADDALLVAHEISERIKAELGVTVSVGVSWNKIFAKFGSDYRKPDAITAITPENYRNVVWNAPVRDLLYVGSATERKLIDMGIKTIGQLAQADSHVLKQRFGKIGPVLQLFAQGCDPTPVKVFDPASSSVDYDIKSIGNGLTAPRDICDIHDAKLLTYLLAESVAQRLRESHLATRTVAISVRHARDLLGYTRQKRLVRPTDITSEIVAPAFALLTANEPLDGLAVNGIRTLGVRAADLTGNAAPVQMDLLGIEEGRIRRRELDGAIDDLRRRYGNNIVRRAVTLGDSQMSGLDIKRDNIVHPVGYFAE